MSNEAAATDRSASSENTGNIASYIDHTLLKPEASEAEILKVRRGGRVPLQVVCVNPVWVKTVKRPWRAPAS